MGRFLLVAAALLACQAQELPLAGVFRDDCGALRALQGIEGAWVSPVLIPEGVDSAGYNGRWLWYKAGRDLHVRNPQGHWAAVPAPGGTAAGQFSSGGDLAGFVFPEVALAARWDIETMILGGLSAWNGELPRTESLGENLLLLRREGGLWAWRPGSDPVLIPLAEAVSFQLFHRDGQNETVVGAAFSLPPAAPGESTEARFRVRNPTGAPILISRLSVDPGAFRIVDQFFPPRYLEPGGFADFSVRYSPPSPGEHTTTLFVNDMKVALTASTESPASVEVELPTGWQVLRASEVFDLGVVERGVMFRRALRVTPAVPLRVEGAGFQLQPGAAAGEFTIVFLSEKPGAAAVTLDAGGRLFPLRVTVTDFPAPRPSIVFPSEPKTALQGRLIVRLAEPARTAYTAVLTLMFTPDAGLPDDLAVAFLPQTVRVVPIRFGAGESDSQEVAFQTGTTAGRITFKVDLGPYAEERTVRILPEPAALSAARAAASSAAVEVALTGFDTTRSVAKLSFTFYLKNGQIAAPGRIDADVSAPFSNYFKSVSGSTFLVRANFPVSGALTELDGVEVEIANSAGICRTSRLRFE